MIRVDGSRRVAMRNMRFVRQFDAVLRNDTRPEPGRRMAVRQSPAPEDPDHKAPAAIQGGEPDVRAEGVHDTQEVHHQEDARQGDQVAADAHDVHTNGDDTQDQGRQDEGVINLIEAQQDQGDHPNITRSTILMSMT